VDGAEVLIAFFLTESRRDEYSRESSNGRQTREQGSNRGFLLGQDREDWKPQGVGRSNSKCLKGGFDAAG
jgi:hypothetical protein